MDKEEKSIFNFLKRKANEPLEVNENYVDTCILVNVKDCRKLVNLIEKQQKEIEKLKDDLKKERALNKSALETLKECVHKDIIKEIIKKHKIFLSSELSTYDENDIENRKAIQYASARLSFLSMDILGKATLNSLYGTMTKESEDNK